MPTLSFDKNVFCTKINDLDNLVWAKKRESDCLSCQVKRIWTRDAPSELVLTKNPPAVP